MTTKPILYLMVGAMGSGKTTLARKIEKEKNAKFFSLDGTIKSFNQPIKNIVDYENFMQRAHDIMFPYALAALKSGQSVVFDVGGPWEKMREIAKAAHAEIIIHHFEIPTEVRWQRVQQRNTEKPEGIYHFTMYRDEFDSQNPLRKAPEPEPGVTIIKITE